MQTQHQTKSELLRSLDLLHLKTNTALTTSKMSLPAIVKLHPPDEKRLHLLTNMPQRFGRESVSDDLKSTPNKPQRFGRSWEAIPKCAECIGEIQNLEARQRKRRNIPCWRLHPTLARAKLWKMDLHWFEEFNFSLDEMKTQIKRLQEIM
ncbi:pro-FMRFamide-related neuropeptide VF isoform X2 [Festucalex cinctus]